jgi:hypothetical protein
MMRKVCELFEQDPDLLERTEVYQILTVKDETNALESQFVPTKIILLAKMMINKMTTNPLKKQKNFYVKVEAESMLQYRTITVSPVYRTLARACKFGINDDKMLSLFKLARTKEPNLTEKYNNNWLYQASLSPGWFERIRLFKGYINYTNQKVKFITEEAEEAFYEKYGYEPDEQPLETKEKVLAKIEKINTWATFYNKYKNNGIMNVQDEELEEFDATPLVY